MRFSIGRRDAACANSTLASYYIGATKELWTGNRAHFSQLAVEEGAPVERNNVRMSYVHSWKDFCSVFLVTDRYDIDSSIVSNGSHPYILRERFTQNTQRSLNQRPSRMGVIRSRGLYVWLIICIHWYMSTILHSPFGFHLSSIFCYRILTRLWRTCYDWS